MQSKRNKIKSLRIKSKRKSFSCDLINSTIKVSKEFNATRCFCVHVTTRKTIAGEKEILQEGIMSRDPFQNWKFSYFNIFVCFPAPNVKCGNTRIIFLMFSPTHHNEPFFLLLTHDGDDFWIMRKSMGKCSQAHVFQAIYFNFDSVHQLKAQGEVTQGKARMENSLWLVLNSINFTFNFLSVGLVVVERKTTRIMNVIAFIAFLEFQNFNQVDVWLIKMFFIHHRHHCRCSRLKLLFCCFPLLIRTTLSNARGSHLVDKLRYNQSDGDRDVCVTIFAHVLCFLVIKTFFPKVSTAHEPL